MQTFTLTEKAKEPLQFEPIPVPNVDDDRMPEILNDAEQAHFKYKKMLELVSQADAHTDGVSCGTWLYDFMTEYCGVPAYEDSAMDVLSHLKKHLQAQAARFSQFCADLEAEIEDAEEQRRNDEKYGTYEEQVRSLFYSTR